jgi:oxygen-independent coproporphyrinogen-3 oxidase
MLTISHDLIHKFHQPVPRYTSYPTAPIWQSLEASTTVQALKDAKGLFSLYLHIPFCHSMCLYCGCGVILNRKAENEERYVQYLIQEIKLTATWLTNRSQLNQIHFGGGTPTKLTAYQLERILQSIQQHFDLLPDAEVSIEIDPRTVFEDKGEKLKQLKEMGFNRVSFGVQDTDTRVQAAVARHQSKEMTYQTFFQAKALGFEGINIDLIYGLPLQTPETFYQTISDILQLSPDRLSLFSYANVPWLKPHQKAIKPHLLPTVENKFQLYWQARRRLIEAGYVAIGMDHFAKDADEIACAYKTKKLIRNFQGYSVARADQFIGLGVTAIGLVSDCYVQNVKDLKGYYEALDLQQLPTHKGWILTEEDRYRKWVIHTLMCQFELSKELFQAHFNQVFDLLFKPELEKLKILEDEGLIILSRNTLTITKSGELFIRNIVSVFDAYLEHGKQRFSSAI